MAISSIASYVTTADEVIAHWTDVNADRVATALPEIIAQGGYSLTDFTADRDALESVIVGLEGFENARDLATADRDAQKANLRERLRQFRAAVELHLKKTGYFRATPRMPNLSISESKFLRPFDDMADLWGRIDADTGIDGFTPPLLLQAGYTLAGFNADVATMRTLFRGVTDAENDQEIARKQRDSLLAPFRERMQQYVAAIELEFGPGHPFFESLPSLSPSSGSSPEETPEPSPPPGTPPEETPDPLALSGFWDSMTQEAVLSWTAWDDPNLADYEMRMSPGATYDAGNATVLSSFPSDTDPLEFRTAQGLANPGDVASFKVFAVDVTGAEQPSNTVTITRP